ncbi:MAG: hypothetical protein H7288_06945 [Kineosporiaceae bacterium]|nr:hypothetical protein [Aeromicrobium sp.]
MSASSGSEVSMTLREREQRAQMAALDAARTPEERERSRRGREAWDPAAAEYVAGTISAQQLAVRAADGT